MEGRVLNAGDLNLGTWEPVGEDIFIDCQISLFECLGSAEPELESFLKHQDPYVRMRVAIALIGIEPSNGSGYETLDNLLRSSDSQLRRRTIDSLTEIGRKDEPLKALIERSLKDPSEEVRESASALMKLLKNKS